LGRPSKQTPEREARLIEALRAGNTRKAACHYAGIEERTFQRWMQHSVAFVASIEKAESDAEVRMVAQIAKAAQDGTWQAAAWWLERRRSDDYARREKVDLEVYVRQRARELGLDENEAYESIRPRLKLVS
jgi:pyruvate/2-oxoglutarate dehydrogenase complex dihydrolipoamide acyltransferase (E2) component